MDQFSPRAEGHAKQINIVGDHVGDIDASTTVVTLTGSRPRRAAILAGAFVLSMIAAVGVWVVVRNPDSVPPDLVPPVTAEASPDGWGPGRSEYHHDERPMNTVVLNSVSNNPAYGDERDFFRVRDLTDDGPWGNAVTLIPGHDYEFSIFYSNNSPGLVATFLRARTAIPALVRPNSGTGQIAKAHLSASNAAPKQVWDTVRLETDTVIDLRYVQASARIHNNGPTDESILSSALFADGTLIGSQELNGVLVGGGEYDGTVRFTVTADKPGFNVEAAVRFPDTPEWKPSVSAAPGQRIEVQIAYQNTGTTDQLDVTVAIDIPPSLTFTPGSAIAVSPAQPNGVGVSDDLTGRGINIGHYHGGDNAFIYFLLTTADTGCGTATLAPRVITANGTKTTSAEITVTHPGCRP
ncbi:hypothetical protein [Nocardia cyriacigeorgica]|uniref:hypothetical protein n=1 Tax=Nocardia cyriacigeorgica TaxID=135487 RepID=UPI002455A7D2|nr:hypothetical protein [Nocardia cyriacigeorgica]